MKFISKLLGIDEESNLRKAAELDDPSSSYRLALFLIRQERDSGYSEKLREINSLLMTAAEAGIIEAAYKLGIRTKHDPSNTAYKWLRHAAINGHLDSAVF